MHYHSINSLQIFISLNELTKYLTNLTQSEVFYIKNNAGLPVLDFNQQRTAKSVTRNDMLWLIYLPKDATIQQ
jgi:hypothetical protein